ncbi:hypothetical protein [Devosia ginsengisoli]|uniref:hypothetical protein n=1 Tax=Devosia ginsengisoli TaxID=400770 RepID=UPI0026F1DD65|nr:hypothetical protein [Devosia ginsengisoli]MCR6673239.1 hypothetical protein [Devosia ginsengisoli]
MASIPTLDADPCGRAAALRAVIDKIATGGSATEVEFEAGNGTRRRVRYTQANLTVLNRLLMQAEAACSGNSGRGKQFAIGGRF